jgi:3-oxoacyl-[acyl-carrier-protein] synthase II
MINSLGLDKESSFKAIVEGQCGIKSISSFDTTEHSVTIAGEITDFDPNTIMNPKEVKKADRLRIVSMPSEPISIRPAVQEKEEKNNG